MALTSTRWSWLPTPTRMDARQIATDELRVLLESDNWQDRITAAWLAAFDRRSELHDEIAEHLQSDDDMIGVVQGCSFALANRGRSARCSTSTPSSVPPPASSPPAAPGISGARQHGSAPSTPTRAPSRTASPDCAYSWQSSPEARRSSTRPRGPRPVSPSYSAGRRKTVHRS